MTDMLKEFAKPNDVGGINRPWSAESADEDRSSLLTDTRHPLLDRPDPANCNRGV